MILLVFLILGSVSATDSDDLIASDEAADDLGSDNLENDILNEEEVDVDDENFAALDNAIQNVGAGGTIHLNTNVTLNGGTSGEETTYANGMTISKDLTINGYNQAINATDANGNKVRLFTIASGAHVTLKDLTITGASYIGDGNQIGGAITVNGGYLTLINVNFINNYAQMTAKNKIGSAAVMVYNGGTVNVTGGSFVNNTLKHDQAPNTAGGGAAINANQGSSSIYVDGTLFENNEAIFGKISNQAGGGAIASLNSIVSIANSEFVNNRLTCNVASAIAGAVYAIPNGRSSMVVNTTFRDNSAHSVSALYFRGTDYVVTGCLFEGNVADDSVSAQFESGGEIHHNAFTDGKISKNQYVNENKDYYWYYNWWGTNEPSDVGLDLTNWMVMTIEHDDNNVVVKLTKLNDGTELGDLALLPTMEATITGLGETKKVKIVKGVGTLTLDGPITDYAGNTVVATVNDQSLSFAVYDKVKSFSELESNIQNTPAGGTYDVKGDFQLNTGVTGEESTYAQGITIDKDIIIDGHGLTINATDANGNKVRIFKIVNGATVTLKDIILTGASADNGGAILVDDGTLTLNNVTFTENNATNGGAVYSVEGNVNIVNSTFVKNTATSSAVQIEKGTIEGSIFEGNSAGAVTLGSAASANYNVFSNGQTVSGTGNFDYNWWKTNAPENVGVTLNNWIVMNITNDDTLIKVSFTTLNNGANVPNPEKFPELPVTVSWDDVVKETTLENGIATVEFDKAVTYDSNYNVSIKVSEVSTDYTLKPIDSDHDNFAQLDSKIKDANENDVIDLENGVKLNEVNINEETTYKNGIVIDKSITIDGHGFTINATDANGNKVRIFNIANADVTLKNMILTSGSVASPGGAAIYINGGSLTLINVTLIDNKVTALTGAALSANNAQVTVINSSFINNTLTKTDYSALGGGAAIYLNGGSLNVDNSLFEGNVYNGYSYSSASVGGGGGAIYTTTATTNILNSRFIRNSAIRTGGSGELVAGALLIKTGIIKGNIFEGNTATSAPNTMRVTDADAIVNYNAFVGTDAQTVGGSADYQYNWWGTNNPQSVGVTLNNWIVMDYYNDGKDIYATLTTLNDGSEVPNPESLPIRESIFTWEGTSHVINTTNGVAHIEFDNEIIPGKAYESTSKIDSQTLSLTIKPEISSISITEIVNTTYGSNGIIKFVVTGADGFDPCGSISLWLNDTIFTVPFNNGEWSLAVGDNLDGGVYDIYFKYDGDQYYTTTIKEKSARQFAVSKIDPLVNVVYKNSTYLELDTIVTVDLTGNAIEPTGTITINIDGKNITSKLNKGQAFIPIGSDLNVSKDYYFTISYSGDNAFNPFETQQYLLTVLKYNTTTSGELSKSVIPMDENTTISITITPEGVEIEGGDGPVYTLDKDSPADMLSELGYLTSKSPAPTASISSSGVSIISPGNGDDRYVVLPAKGNSIEFKFISVSNKKFTICTYNPTVEFDKLSYAPYTYLDWSYSKWKYKPPSGNPVTLGYTTAPKNGDIFKVTIEDGKVYYYINDVLVASTSHSYSEAYFGFKIYAMNTNVVDEIAVYGDGGSGSSYVPSVVPTGNVSVKIGELTKEVPIVNGKIDLTLGDTLNDGIYDVEISYKGDGYYNPSFNNTLKLEVKKVFYNATIDIDSADECELGKNITISIEVTGLDGLAPTGEVTVKIGDIVRKFDASEGLFTIDAGYNFTAGEYEISVFYKGDDNYLNKSSNATFTINQQTPSFDITTSDAKVVIGDDAIVYIKVNPINGVIPTGNVTVKVQDFIKELPLDKDGQTSYNVGEWLVKGSNDVEIIYNGDVNYKTISENLISLFNVTDIVYVNATVGDDENGDGSSENPFKSIKKAFSLMKGNGTIVLNGIFKGSDNIGLTYSSSKMIDVDIIGNDAVIDAEMTRTSMFTINKVNVRFINLTFNNSAASSSTYGSLINVVDADSLDIINSTFTNIYEQNGKSAAIYLKDWDVSLNITNSHFDNVVSHHSGGVIATDGVNQGLSNARNKIYIDNSTFSNLKAHGDILIDSSNAFGAGADVIITNSVFTNAIGIQDTYSSFIEAKSLNMSNCVISNMDFNTKWDWIKIKEGNLDYNFWSSNNPDFSHIQITPNNWIVMTFDNESSVFKAALNTLNNGSSYTDLNADVIFSDNLNPSTVRLDNGVAEAILEKTLRVGEKVTATVGSLTLSLVFQHDIEGMSSEVTNAIRWQNGTVNITVEGKEDVTPTGNVTIWINNVPYTVDLVEGNATLRVGDDLAVGSYISKFQYNGDENYYSSDIAEFIFTVDKTFTNITTVAESVEYGKPQTITFALTSDEATGNFTVLVNNKPYTVYVNDPKLDLGILNAGEYTIIVTYNGDENYNVARNETAFNVTKKQTVPIVKYDETVKVGNNQTVEVEFTECDENATVKLELNGNIKLQTISGNKAVFELADLKEGNYTFTITYEGMNYIAESVSKSFKVTKNELDITAYAINATAGNNISIIISGIPDDAKGVVTVTVDGTNYGARLADGKYVAEIPALKVGENTATITFSGDDKYGPARTTADFNVTPLNVDVKLDVGSEITKDSTITISAPGATGEIIVIVDDEVKTLPLVDGNAIYSLENISYGDHNLVVIYNGVVSHVTQFTIEKLDVDITASADPIDVGDVAEIIVTLNETAKGSVVVDGKYYGEINEGQAIISISGLANGTHTFTVKYSGDEVFNEAETTVTVIVNKLQTVPQINVESIQLGEDAYIEVTLPDGATGSVTVYIDDNEGETYDLIDSSAYITVSDLTNGTHTVKVVYSGDDNYRGAESTESFNVIYDITIDGDSLYGEDSIIEINLPDGAEGNVTVIIGDKTFNATVEDGVAYVNASALDYGTHEVTVKYSGDEKYPAKTVTGEITVDANINIPDEVPYNDGEITISLPSDATGNVTVTIDDETNVTVPVVNGTARIPLDKLSMGDHKITATYSGDDDYKKSSVSRDVTVNPNINVPDELTTGDNEISIALPSDAEGNLTVNIDGNKITVPVINGTSSVPISNLSAGDHDISVEYSGDGKYDSFQKNINGNVAKVTPSANVNAPSSIVAGKATNIAIDLPKDATGIVLVDVDGNKYYASIENGVANVNVAGLAAGDKQLTYQYLGDAKYNAFNGTANLKVVNQVVPKPKVDKIVLKSKNMKVKKSAKKLVLKATLKINGKAVKGKKITFKFKGKKYVAKTNKKGVAKVTIKKKVIKKLKKGKKYKFNVSYLKTKITKKVTVKK